MHDKWPDDFSNYENVLEIGASLSKACRFLDPMDSTLVETVHDLRRNRPCIKLAEISRLLGIEAQHANSLFEI